MIIQRVLSVQAIPVDVSYNSRRTARNESAYHAPKWPLLSQRDILLLTRCLYWCAGNRARGGHRKALLKEFLGL